jgi:glycosyltransferase involved in cell wall biosynthesis
VAVKLSIVIPTLGRPSLERTLASCAGADEIVVVLDTVRGTTELPCALPPNAVYVEGYWGITGGHGGRQEGIQRASGTHLAFMDDDDVYLPGAIDLMREAACDVPVIFRMDHYTHGVLWRDRAVRFGNVSTQMYVVPNDPARLGTWRPHIPGIPEPGGDYTFISETCERMGEPVWHEEVIATLRPDIERPFRRPSLSIVTPWHNHRELLGDYMAAVELGPDDELVIVDNGSDPPLSFASIRSEENLGFVGGSNLGLVHAQGEIVLFLNNDVALREHGWLEQIREAVGPGVLAGPIRYDPHADVDGERFPYIDGWCLTGMRDDLLELGGFPAGLEEPAYYSDNLLCLEARTQGMTLRDVRVRLAHKESTTSQPQRNPQVQRATRANREIYAARAREALQVATAS